ncbi:hypothetical protein VP01_244g1, partial [Puccinia sorghi]
RKRNGPTHLGNEHHHSRQLSVRAQYSHQLNHCGRTQCKGMYPQSQKFLIQCLERGPNSIRGKNSERAFLGQESRLSRNYDQTNSTYISNPKESLMDIHEKLGHTSIQRIEPLLGDSISKSDRSNFKCKACTLSKITKQPFKRTSKLSSKPFDRIHLDLIGPIKSKSSLKHNFILTLVDNYTGYLAGFPKEEGVLTFFNLFRRRGETLKSSGIQKRFWHKIVKSCCLMLNQIPHGGGSKSPWELLQDKQFLNDLLRTIGTPALILNSNRIKGRKFDIKGEESKLVGFNVALRSFQIFTSYSRVIESKHVRFLNKTEGDPILNYDNLLEFKPEPASWPVRNSEPQSEPESSDHREKNHDQDNSGDLNNDSSEDDSEIVDQILRKEPTPAPVSQPTTRVL